MSFATILSASGVVIPDWLGDILFTDDLTKGAGHRYIRRVATGNPRRPWRYYYSVSGGKGIGHGEEFQVGSKFKVAHNGQAGHFEIVGKTPSGDLRIKHDETGHESTVSSAVLRDMLHKEHATAISAHREKLAGDIKAANGSAARDKLKAEAAKYSHTADWAKDSKAEQKTPDEPRLPAGVKLRIGTHGTDSHAYSFKDSYGVESRLILYSGKDSELNPGIVQHAMADARGDKEITPALQDMVDHYTRKHGALVHGGGSPPVQTGSEQKADKHDQIAESHDKAGDFEGHPAEWRAGHKEAAAAHRAAAAAHRQGSSDATALSERAKTLSYTHPGAATKPPPQKGDAERRAIAQMKARDEADAARKAEFKKQDDAAAARAPATPGLVPYRGPGYEPEDDDQESPQTPREALKAAAAQVQAAPAPAPAPAPAEDVNITHSLTPGEARKLDYRLRRSATRTQIDNASDELREGLKAPEAAWLARLTMQVKDDPFALRLDVPEVPKGMAKTKAKGIVTKLEAIRDKIKSDLQDVGHFEAHDDYDTYKIHDKAYHQVADNIDKALGASVGHAMRTDTSGIGLKAISDAALHGDGKLSKMATMYAEEGKKERLRPRTDVDYYKEPAYSGGPTRAEQQTAGALYKLASDAETRARWARRDAEIASAFEAKGFPAGAEHHKAVAERETAGGAFYRATADAKSAKATAEREAALAKDRAEDEAKRAAETAAAEAHLRSVAKPGEEMIRINTNNGEVPVLGKVHHGEYAVHRPHLGGTGFVVTHLKSGRRVATVPHHASGAKLVEKIRAAAPDFGKKGAGDVTNEELRAVQDVIQAHGAK